MPLPQETELLQWDYLVAKFVTASAVGSGRQLAVQTNIVTPTNPTAIAGVQVVKNVCPPEGNIFPSVGCQLDSYNSVPVASRTDEVTAYFDIVVAVLQPMNDAVADTMSAALTALRNYVNDGNGNGMSPLLRADRTLNGLCTSASIQSMKYVVYKAGSSSAGTIASAWYRLVTSHRVTG